MVTTSSRTNKSSGSVFYSQSPSSPFCGAYSKAIPSSSSSLTAFASSTSSSFSSPSSSFFGNHHENHSNHRSASPTRVNLLTAQPMSQSIRYSFDNRSTSPTSRSISISKKQHQQQQPTSSHKISRRCMCSPTTHPGSFRCSLHKNVANPHGQGTASSSYPSNGLNMRRSAMTNSLVRIGGVEGEWVRRSLTTLIRPSSHHLKRRASYQPRPSRFSNHN
ncbi:unnamed protein product [Cochlearia groenlandica]